MTAESGFLLIRCNGCSRPACTARCPLNVLLDIKGELLIDTARCGECPGYEPGRTPGCIDRCGCSADKVRREIISPREKRAQAAAILPLLSAKTG